MRAYRQECYNSFDYFIYFSLSSQHISLSVSNTALSLSPFWSPSLRCFLFLSHFHFFLSLTLFLSLYISVLSPQIWLVSAPLSLFLFFPVTISLSFFSCHEEEGNSDLKQSSLIEACQYEPLLADLNLCSPKGSRRSLLVVLHSRWSLLVVLHSSRRRWLVEFGHWLICWVGVLLKILSFLFYYFILLRFLDLEFVGGSGDCGCSLWRWL